MGTKKSLLVLWIAYLDVHQISVSNIVPKRANGNHYQAKKHMSSTDSGNNLTEIHECHWSHIEMLIRTVCRGSSASQRSSSISRHQDCVMSSWRVGVCQGAKMLFLPHFTLKPSGCWLIMMKFGFYSSLCRILVWLSHQCPTCLATFFGGIQKL